MSVRPKRLPRLWCAQLGLLPFDVILPSEAAAQGIPSDPGFIADALACAPGYVTPRPHADLERLDAESPPERGPR